MAGLQTAGTQRAVIRRLLTAACGAALLVATLVIALPRPAVGAAPAPAVPAVSPRVQSTGSISEAASFPQSSESIGNSSIAIDPQHVGDLVVLSMQVHTTAISIASVSDVNVGDWQPAIKYPNSGTDTLYFEVWWGVVTGTGPSTININYSGSVASDSIELIVDSFTSGSQLPWSQVTQGGASGGVSNTAQWPSLTSGSNAAAQLYWGASEEETAATPGSTPGFSYGLTGESNCFLYNGALSPNTPYAPSCNIPSAAVSTEVGVIFALGAPSVTSVSPGAGPTGGGNTVTVTGTGLTNPTAVYFGSTQANFTGVSDNTLTAVAPPGAGTVDVTVVVPGGWSTPTVQADQYIYTTGPTVSSVAPNSGPTGGGTTVLITGTGLTGATSVDFGSTPATSFNVLSDTSLAAVVPPGSGTVNVTVTATGGTSPVVAQDQYTYASTKASIAGGYDMVGSDGGVFVFPTGGSGFYGSLPGLGIHVNDIVGIVPTLDQKGYWLVGHDGGVFAFGDAGYVGSLPGLGIHVSDIVAIVPTSTDKGYWLVGRDGGVFAFGDATYVQSLPGLHVSVNDIVGIAPTATNKGYWLIGADGSVYTLGDAHYYGGSNGAAFTYWLVGMVATHSGNGYWLVAADGRVTSYGDAVSYGDLPTMGVHITNVTSLVPTQDDAGYWLIGHDGGVFSFGDAGFAGSLPGLGVHVTNIIGAVPTT